MELSSNKKSRNKKVTETTPTLYGKIPPQAIELEKAILGAILIDQNCLPDVLNILFSEIFYLESHQFVYQAVVKLYDSNNKIDILTVIDQLKKMEKLEEAGGVYQLSLLTDGVVSSAHIDSHCRIIMEMYMKREMIKIGGDALCEAYEDSSDVFELYDKTDNRILTTQEKILTGEVKDMSHYASKVVEEYHTVKTTGVLGIKTGIEPIDNLMCGIVSPDLFVIAARPSQGKTALAMSISHNISVVQQIPGAWFSLEMNGTQLTRRLASLDSGIHHGLIRTGRIPDFQEKDFLKSIDRISSAPIYIEDKGSMNVRSIRVRSNILVRKNKIKYIIVDYLQLMEGVDPKNKSRNDIVAEITRGLKLLAMELNIPVIALSQLSREVEKREDKMPQLSDLRESGGIEQDADNVLFLMRPEKYGMTSEVSIGGKNYNPYGLCIGKIDKNRSGPCVNFAMSFHGECMQIKTHEDDLYKSFSNAPVTETSPLGSEWKPVSEITNNPF